MAYLRDLDPGECWETGCTSAAKVELLNRRNGSCGQFCKRHGKQRLKAKEAQERGDS